MKRGKKYQGASEKLIADKKYTSEEAFQFIVAEAPANFDETVEVHIRLGIDPKKGEELVRGAVVLPHGTGKSKKIAAVTESQAKEAKAAGADLVGSGDIIEMIKSGKFFGEKYDVLVATPDMMRKLAPVAKILGPRGLMPSPKAETVSNKITEAIESLKKGKVNFKNDSTAIVHQPIGKVSFGASKLAENYDAFMDAIRKSKSDAVKGRFIVSIAVCSTMGPSIKLEK
jgi:large subunit ribosomal protein L1